MVERIVSVKKEPEMFDVTCRTCGGKAIAELGGADVCGEPDCCDCRDYWVLISCTACPAYTEIR